MEDLSHISGQLRAIQPGFWVAGNQVERSYPDLELANSALFDDKSFWFKHRASVLVKLLEKYNSGPVFDIGGGAGYMSLCMQNSGYDAILLEPGEDGVGVARRRGVKKVIHSTIQEAGIKDNSLTSVGLFDVIEHFEDDKIFLSTISKVTQPGGYLFITVPAYNFLWSEEDKFVGHFRRYTAHSMNELLLQSGFEVKYSTYLFSFLVAPIFFLRAVPSYFGKKLRHIEDRTKVEEDHTTKFSIIGRIVDFVCGLEKWLVNRNFKIPFGSTYLVVAQKK